MGRSLKSKLILSYVLITVTSIFLISILANVFLQNEFKNYVIKNQQLKNNDILQSISNAYDKSKQWNIDVVENVGMDAMQYGMIVSVFDISGKKIWDAREFNNGICEAMIDHMTQNMMKYNVNWKGGYVEKTSTVYSASVKIGTVKIGYYGPYFFTDNDLTFLRILNRIIVGVGVVTLILALIIGLIIAGSISRPILRVIKTARSISKGNYTGRIHEMSSIREIKELTASVNDLAEGLEKQEALRKKLTGDVAHELRTPLSTLQSHMEAIIDGVWEPSIDRISSCYEEILRINRMVGDLEKVAKYEGGNFSLEKTNFNLREMLKNVLTNFQGDFLSKNITVELVGEDMQIFADRDKITQVAVNLISNALKYTPEYGAIEICIREEKNIIELVVRDNGIGIAEKDLPYIFERFYRADESRSRATGGAGIGLTITKSIVESHDGTISVKSKPGEGTEFKVTFKK